MLTFTELLKPFVGFRCVVPIRMPHKSHPATPSGANAKTERWKARVRAAGYTNHIATKSHVMVVIHKRSRVSGHRAHKKESGVTFYMRV